MLDNEGHGHVRPRRDERDAESGTGGAKRPNVEALAERAMGAEEPTYFSCAVIALATYIAALEEAQRKQAAAALTGMDAAKKAGAEMLRLGQQKLDEAGRMAAHTSFAELESQRQANAMLTAQVEALEAERDALRAEAERYRWARKPENASAVYHMIDRGECGANMDARIDDAIAAKEPK